MLGILLKPIVWDSVIANIFTVIIVGGSLSSHWVKGFFLLGKRALHLRVTMRY